MQDLGFRAVGFMVRRGLLGYFGGTRYGTEGMVWSSSYYWV